MKTEQSIPDINPDSDDEIKLENHTEAGHLKEGFNPIVVCAGSEDIYCCNMNKLVETKIKTGEIGGGETDISDNPENLVPNGGGYISKIDRKAKHTKEMMNCTSAVVVGKSKDEPVDLSFLTHQTPKICPTEEFKDALRERMRELKGLCIEGSVDVVITGGMLKNEDQFNEGWGEDRRKYHEQHIHKFETEYEQSIESLNAVTEEVFGFKPTIIGPKSICGDAILFDTQNRRLYLLRPPETYGNDDVHMYNDSFTADQFDNMKEKWFGNK